MESYTLYGGAISYYTGKARAYLRYKNVPFIEEGGSREIFERVGRRIIPVLHTPDDELIQDTTDIIDFIEQKFPEPTVYPEDPVQRLVSLLFEVYGDEWLIMPGMHYRWAYNLDFILEEFGKNILPDGTAEEQREIGAKISAPFRGSLPMLGITAETVPGLEARYEEFLTQFNEHLEHHWYLFGTRPSIGDYGLMGPLYAHNFRDPWSGNLMMRIAPNVARWVSNMNTPAPNSGHFLPAADFPDTLLPMLKVMFEECVPTILETIEMTAAWIDENPDAEEVPRTVGEHSFILGGCKGTRQARSFSQWMFQRPLSYYQSLAGDDRKRCDALLESVGGFDAMQTKVRRPVRRLNNKLVAV